MSRDWRDRGDGFELEWGGRAWVVEPGARPVGLRTRAGGAASPIGPLLAIEGTAAAPGAEAWATAPPVRSSCEIIGGLVRLTEARGDLTVVATWGPSDDDAVDLTIEARLEETAAHGVPGFEVLAASVLPEPPGGRRRRWVEPRDAATAALGYDGRAGDVGDLTTLPPPADGRLAPGILPSPWEDGASYVEFCRRGDVARRTSEALRINSVGRTTRYGLFGRDLAPGGRLVATLRGAWILAADAAREALDRAEAFEREAIG